jgi:hypothetical protein
MTEHIDYPVFGKISGWAVTATVVPSDEPEMALKPSYLRASFAAPLCSYVI